MLVKQRFSSQQIQIFLCSGGDEVKIFSLFDVLSFTEL